MAAFLLLSQNLGTGHGATYLLSGTPCFKRGLVSIVVMGAHMVVGDIGEFFYYLVHLLLRPEFIQIGAFVFQGVEIPFHRRIVVRVSRFAHALGHTSGFTEFHKCF